MIADELRRQADFFIELKDLEKKVGRAAGQKPDRDYEEYPGDFEPYEDAEEIA
jgi:uncharacterized LabA/DUF88 family protein